MSPKIRAEDFLRRVLMLETVEFIGVARILGVQLVEEEIPREFEAVLKDMMLKYERLSRTQRRNLMRIINSATKEGD